MRPSESPQELERRRFRGLALLREGLSPVEVAAGSVWTDALRGVGKRLCTDGELALWPLARLPGARND
jgi:hypothetical protein